MADLSAKMLVINEWIFHDLQGENEQEKQLETFRFLQNFEHEQDRLAVLKGSPWMQKVYGLMRNNDMRTKAYSTLMRRIVMDSRKCLILQPEAVEDAAPKDAIDAAPEEDVYLIQTYYAAGADLLITTDEDLHDAFVSRQDVNVIFRNDFLKDYLNS